MHNAVASPRSSLPVIHRLSVAVGIALLALAVPAGAAPVPAAAPPASDKPTALSKITVRGIHEDGYAVDRTATATKTDTPLRDIPQSISIVTQQLIRDQAMHDMADVVRYMPGVGMAQGEGNRDTPVLRGNSSTADFFIDGLRDDVQYFRDVYNIERVEALKGPNAMIFGRGGSGGVLNRVTKIADWDRHREVSLQVGSWNRRRGTLDFGQALDTGVAFRVTGLYEDSDSYRDGVTLERYGINPTATFRLGEATTATLGVEHFRDQRIADRGVPSFQGRPLATAPEIFFGNPGLSPVDATVDAFNAVVEHDFGNGVGLRNATRYADYDKFYQNVFPGAVSADGTTVAISAYNNDTQRTNLFNQTDLTFALDAGATRHTLLAGAEFGRQETDNLRQTGFFDSVAPGTASVSVPLANPRTALPVSFRPKAGDADNHGVARVAALYAQDQIEFSPHWQAILGLRLDRFTLDLRNNRNGELLSSSDTMLSPRAGLIYKPREEVSLYASYSHAFQPRAGEQLASLKADTQALDPEEFRNVELGAKWDIRPSVAATFAVYQLERGNVAIADPSDPTRSILVDGQRSEGVELGLSGNITERWRVMGGYAWQDGEITRTQSASVQQGARLAQLPEHSFSLWSRYDFNPAWGVGLGAIYRSELFASTDNQVALPGYTRFDAAVFYHASERLQLQLNVENLFDRAYFVSAHSNNNITPGSPRAAYLSATLTF